MFSNVSIASQGQQGQITRQSAENGVVHLAEQSKVLLEISPDAIAGYSKDGPDLLVTLKTGETLRIANFYPEGQPASELFLLDKDQVVAVDLAVASDGTLAASYVPQEGMAGFESLTAADSGNDDGLSTGAIVLLGALAAGGAGVAIHNHNSGGGGGGRSTEETSGPLPPIVARDLAISVDGALLSGKTEAGKTVKVDIDGDGVADLTVVAGADGSFEVPLDPPLVDGETVSVVVVQADGSNGPAVTVQAPDYPDAPEVNPTNGTVLTGTAEAGIGIVITDGDGKLIGQTTADSQGNWTFTPATPLANDTLVNVVAKSPKDLSSEPATTTVDALAPDVPTINPTNGTQLAGTAEAGAKVILTDGNGNSIGSTTADASGNWSFTPASQLPNATVVNVVAQDAVGNTSPQASTTVDSVAPNMPTINASNGTLLTGTAEAGTQVILTRENGQVVVRDSAVGSNATIIGSATVDANGNWTLTPVTRLPNGTVVHVVSKDAAGNVSELASTTIDSIAPDAPVINPSNGSALVGTAEANSTVILTNGNGQAIGQVKADSSGHWTFTPASPLANGTVVNAVARDAAGNTSVRGTTTIDSVAPNAPVIEPSNGTVISGTAEAGSRIILTNSSGQVIGETTTNSSGHWTFTPNSPLANGAQIHAVARDAVGNTSPQATGTIDALAPAAPVINLSNGSVLMGTAEAGAKVILTTGNGQPLAQVTADANGNWSYTPGTPLANGTVVHAVARDAAGNTSPQTSTTVDSVAPNAPVIEPSNGTVLTGTAEAGSKLILTLANGTQLGEVTVGGNGHWTFTPTSPLANGTVVHAVACDAVGNTSPQATATIDSVAPAAPVIEPTNGSIITGTAEPGAKITLTDGSGNPIGQTTTDSSGHWSFTPATQLADGTVVRAVATDAAGNTGAPGSAVVDGVAPAAPTVDISNGSALTGTAEPNSKVIISNGNGQPIGQVTADGNGNWTYTPATPIANGTVVNVVAQDAAGNVSPPATTTVDSQAPAAPVINPSNGSTISGTAEAGSIVKLTLANGTPLAQITADGNGNWSFTPGTPLANGTVVRATATDAAGNVSPSSSTTIDSVAPDAPEINPSNGTVISGTAEAGSKIILTDGNGNPIGETLTGGNGQWSFTPGSPLPDGTVINAVAQDPAGNTGPQASTTVDAVAPAAPVINPTNGAVITGTAEANSTVTLTDGNGSPIGQTTADGNGNWSFVPGTALANGSEVNATATDAAGNTSQPGSVIVDTSLPSIPVIDPSNGTVISGTADAGNTIILRDGNGSPIGQVTADGNGNWSFTPGTPLPDGTVVNAIARNPAGIDSAPATITIDGVAPDAPTINPTNGVEITGTAEAGATITLTSGTGTPIGQTTADANGNWSFTPGLPLPNGTVINAVATDPSGNTSPPASVTVDAVAPATPVVEPSNGLVITGTAEAGSKLLITDGNGTPIGSTTADGSGNWSFAPASPLADGTVITVVAQDAAGNTSSPATATVDAIAPEQPVLEPSNGSVISGTAEAGSTVIITDGSGNPIGQVTADGSGNWSFTPGSPLANGTVINVVARDAVGNTSAPATTTVDSVAPGVPVVNPSNGSEISGTAEAGASVIITDGSGNPIGQVTADGSGNWSFTPGSPLANGTVINVVARDAAGNTSAPASTTVDSVAPNVPVIEPSNGTEISGTAEAGSTIIITDGNGTPIGSTTTDGNGDWSFTPGTPLGEGTVITVVAQDPAGNTSPPVSTTVDSIAPDAPVINPSNGVVVSGTAEAGATIIITDGNGAPIGSTTADGNGNWSFTPGTPLGEGTVVTVVAQDAAGNTSPPASTTVDSVAPDAPVLNPSNGTVISGTAEAGAKVILTNGAGAAIGSTTADSNGNWSFTPATPLANGTVINAIAQDAAGNNSAPASTTVDAVAPNAPVVNPSNGTEVTGTAEPGSTVIITDGNGDPIGSTTTDNNGDWTFTPTDPLPDGTVITVVVQDPAGNTSPPVSTTVDAVAPDAPVINPSNGTVISGTAEAGATIIITDGNGDPIGSTTADGSGNWSFTPAAPLADGTEINVVAQDAAGNASQPASITVDAIAPTAPVVNPSNGTEISGTAEAGSTIIITDGAGNPIGSTTADGNGDWSFTPTTPLANGTVVTVVAEDAAGNTSPAATTTVDSIAPLAPVVNPSNGTEISGTAEAGSTIIITDGNGSPIGSTTANGNGDWSFTPATPLPEGTVVTVVAQDPAGNTSPPASTTVDALAPATPVINPSNGTVISGTAEAGATIIITNGAGDAVGSTTADGNGNWSFTPTASLADGTVINVVARDEAGNDSPSSSITVDAVAPAAPVINPGNGTVISGTAEAGAKIIITDGNGTPVGSTTADGSGNWSFTPTTPLADGTEISVVAQDAAGNNSQPATSTVDALAPAAPVVNPSNGTVISGTAEAGATVIITDGAGTPIGSTTADGNGDWSFTPTTQLANGTVVTVVAQDAAGNASPPVSTTIDSVAPAAPVINPSNGTVISGTAEAGATVIITDGAATPIGSTTADGSGHWSFTPATPLADGTEITVVAQDAAGNTGPAATVTVDAVAPAAPVVNPSNGTVISGTAEAGTKIIITDGNGSPIGSTTADGTGNWSFTPTAPLADGTEISVVAQDAAGNTGPAATVTVDAVAPAAPVVNPSNGSEISGTAEAGAIIIITDGAGTPIGSTTADGNGDWSFTPTTALTDGTVISVVAQDASGNTGPAATVTVDAIAPAAPVINPSNGTIISGTAEPGSTIIITDGAGNPIGSTTANGVGNWSFTPGTALANGTEINVVARDESGNNSQPSTITVDAVAPDAPVINPTNGTVISGTAEAGAKVILTTGTGTQLAVVTADSNGDWSYTPVNPLVNGTVVNAVAQDAAGNNSPQASTTVDTVASGAPVINPTNGTVITGTAEAGNTIRLTDGNGNSIGSTTVDGNGNWSFTPVTPLADGTVVTAVAEDTFGNLSDPTSVTVDAVAPVAPVINPTNGTVITGTAEAGAKVILTNGVGAAIGETTADGNGNWSFTPTTPLPNGTVVNAVAQDAAGNTGPQATATVDAIAPAVPVINPSNGTVISGTAEAGAKIIITDGNGAPIGSTTANGSGNWSFTPATPLPNGAVVHAAAQDAAGNTSGQATATVDAIAPNAPVINPTNGTVISGTAEAGARIILTDGNGAPIGETTAAGNGSWSFTPATPLANGTVIDAVARDAAGNVSPQATATVDSLAPNAPVINPTNGFVISGTAEAGAKVILTTGSGTPLATVTADASGNWSYTPLLPLLNGVTVNAVAQDAAGNTSAQASTTVDTVAPLPPVINPTNGVTITGTAEAGAKVILTTGLGVALGQTTADANGNWTFTPTTPLPNGIAVQAVAQDPAGNSSLPSVAIVDAIAPPTPVINPTNGTTISGTAEAGAKVILTTGAGVPLAEVTANALGIWTYTPGSPLANGTVVHAVAQDAAGNTSGQANATVDSVAPNIPVINPTNGITVSGTAEAGAKVILTTNLGVPLATVTADANGNWSYTPLLPLLNGVTVNAVAQDAAGNNSAQASTVVDAIAPNIPVINPSNGTIISGAAEAGAKVILTTGAGVPLATVTADASGNWSFTPGTALGNGVVIHAVAQDAAGNNSLQANATVDAIAPAAPVVNPSNGSVISGTAEANAKIIITTDAGVPLATVTANALGVWTYTPGTPLANGTVVHVVAQDAAGNNSPQTNTTINSVAPNIPVINATNGIIISGTAEAGAKVILTTNLGVPLATVTADASGNWSYTPLLPLLNGVTVHAVAQDAVGNTSGQASTVVDTIAPPAPLINPSNGTVITGTAEAGAKVILTTGSGTPLGEATANASGVWTFTPGTALANGVVIHAVARDAAGNTSGQTNATVDAIAPNAPVINPSNGVVISGTAEANAKVILTTGSGTPLAEVTANALGVWTYTPGTPLANGTVVHAIARDAAGNNSPQANSTIDSIAPDAPIISINAGGTLLTGTAEANSQVRVTIAGNPTPLPSM